MNKSLSLIIKNPNKILFEDHNIYSIRVPLIDGSMGIRPGHAPLLAEVDSGKILYNKNQNDDFEEVSVPSGLIQIKNDQVTIFCVDMDDLVHSSEHDGLDEMNKALLTLLYDQFSKDVDDAI